ncbi:MAG: molybdenum cofactor biosynthesis protein MoaE, partial [Actinomycetes bacterium]
MGTDATFEVVRAVLSEEPISVDQAIAAVESDTAGAVVSFSGVVRNHDGGKAVERLSYSAHPTAHQVMADVVARLVAEQATGGDAGAEQPVRIWAAHRIGTLQIG